MAVATGRAEQAQYIETVKRLKSRNGHQAVTSQHLKVLDFAAKLHSQYMLDEGEV